MVKSWSVPIDVEKQKMVYGVPIKSFFGFYKYRTNAGLSWIKTKSRKYRRDTPLPDFHSISVFFCKHENRGDKYRNLDGTSRDFFPAPCGGAPYSMVVPQEKLESSIAAIKQDFARL